MVVPHRVLITKDNLSGRSGNLGISTGEARSPTVLSVFLFGGSLRIKPPLLGEVGDLICPNRCDDYLAGNLSTIIINDYESIALQATVDKPIRISAQELHKYVWGLVGVMLLAIGTYPIAMNRASQIFIPN